MREEYIVRMREYARRGVIHIPQDANIEFITPSIDTYPINEIGSTMPRDWISGARCRSFSFDLTADKGVDIEKVRMMFRSCADCRWTCKQEGLYNACNLFTSNEEEKDG